MINPKKLYHGSSKAINGPLEPAFISNTDDYLHTKPAVFATERIDLAALFMFPLDHISSIGLEKDIAYICIWGNPDDFINDKGGYIYELPTSSFQKIGKDYEYQSFVPVQSTNKRFFSSVIKGMLESGVQIYFINDDKIFDKIVANKEHRAPILKTLISENQRFNINIKIF